MIKLPKNWSFIGPEPYEYQIKTFIYGTTRPNAGLFLDQGLGKTRVAIDIARFRRENNQINQSLIISPAFLIYTWKKQIKKWAEMDALILHSSTRKKRIELIHDLDYPFHIINYEGTYPYLKELRGRASEYGLLICDESSRHLSNYNSKTTYATNNIALDQSYHLLLTGTPIANNPLGIFSQYYILDQGKTFGTSFENFRKYFFYEIKKSTLKRTKKGKLRTVYFSDWKLKLHREDELIKRIYSTAIRFDKKVLDLPEKDFSEIVVPMSNKLKSLYEDVKVGILDDLSNGEDFTNPKYAFSFLGKLSKLQQVTAGFIKLPNGEIKHLDKTPKLDYLENFVDWVIENKEAVVIWTIFKESLYLIKKRLSKKGIKIITIDGDDKLKDRADKIEKYQSNNNYPILIGNIKAGGIGTELFKFDPMGKQQHMVYYENLLTYDAREQSIDRTHRIGQLIDCHYIDLYVENSIDEWALACIKSKTSIVDRLINIDWKTL